MIEHSKSMNICIRTKVDVDKKIKRGPESINFIRFVLTILIGLSYVSSNNMPISWYYKLMIIYALIIFWTYICFRCLQFQSVIFDIRNKLEDWI